MKTIKSLLALGVMGVGLLTMPVESNAASPSFAAVEEASSDVLTLTINDESSIPGNPYGNYIGTLSDGTVLYFNLDYGYAMFSGAITSATALAIPEKVSYDGNQYDVPCYGYWGEIYFSDAPNLTSLTLPSSISDIYARIPSSVTELHLLGTNPPRINSYDFIPVSATVYVPVSAYPTYQNYCDNENYGWNNNINVKPEGWVPQSLTVTVNTPGTFGNVLLQDIEQWTDVNELTIIGHLNDDDMNLLSRLKMMTKLDLSQTDITKIDGCSGLTLLAEVLLPSTVVEVADAAFSGCTRLKGISLASVTHVGRNAFRYCSSLASISLPSATEIGDYAFDYCTSLVSVSLPAITEISDRAFRCCYSLTNIDLPVAKVIGVYVFEDCYNLSSFSMPLVTSIGESAFYNCHNLTSASLPAVTFIGSSAFRYCNNLTSVGMPAIKVIGYAAFEDCSNLASVSLSAVTQINEYAFSRCSSLTSVTLPGCLQTLGSRAFQECTSLQDVYCHVVAPLNTEAFENTAQHATLHVPAFSVTSYMLSDSWYTFKKIVALDGTMDNLSIYSDFTLTDFTGLADKVDVTLSGNAHLTVSGTSALNIGTFTQNQSTLYNIGDYYWDEQGNRVYYNSVTTLIAANEIKADNVSLRLQVPTYQWNFISLPFDVNVADIYPIEDQTLWVIRKYSGADRAALTGNTWQNMTSGMVLQAGEGYILHCANSNNGNVEFVFPAVNNAKKNNIFAWQDVVKPLSTYASEYAHNRSWNLVGNPYPAFFDTHSIEHNGVITVYGRSEDYWYGSYSNYTAYSLLDDDYVLRPNEAFFVQCPIDANSMTFKAEGRMHKYDTDGNGNVTRAPRRNAATASSRLVYNFTLTSGDFTDRARLVINPDAKMDYEISCDASKFMSDFQTVPQLYVYDNGIRYAIDERPMGDGIVNLGARFGQTGEYIIALSNNPAEGMSIMLTDHETGAQVNLAEEPYTFAAQAGTSESRFTLQIGSGVTGIDELSILSSQPSTQYDLQGRRVNSLLQNGIYVVRQNGASRKVLK